MKNMLTSRPVFGLLLAALLALAVPAPAQPLEDLIYAAGTTTKDAQNRAWSYLLWQANNAEALRDRPFAVYAKVGDSGSPSLYERKGVVRLVTDPAVITVLVQRAIQLGQNPALLEEHLDTLFQRLLPP